MLTVKLSGIGLPDPQYARSKAGLEPFILGSASLVFVNWTVSMILLPVGVDE